MKRANAGIIAVSLLFVSFAGCADGGSEQEVETCQTGEATGQPEYFGGVICGEDTTGPDTLSDAFPCDAPEDSRVDGSTGQATAGTVDVVVEDAAGTTVFEETFPAGTSRTNGTIGEGQAGEWTFHVSLSEDWSGPFAIGADCGQQGSSQG